MYMVRKALSIYLDRWVQMDALNVTTNNINHKSKCNLYHATRNFLILTEVRRQWPEAYTEE